MSENKMKTKQLKKQQGMTLIIAMIMLLVITGVGVSAVKNSTTDTMMSSNNTLQMLVFQGAESTIVRSASAKDLYDIEKAAILAGTPHTVLHTDLFPDGDEAITNGIKLKSTSIITYQDVGDCPVISGVANSIDFNCYIFEIDAKTNALGARANHFEGKAVLKPKSN
jgi:type II secretory pathway pseudopilin PulG